MTLPTLTPAQSCGAIGSKESREIVLMRHAEAGLPGRFCGHSNPSLSVQGRARLPAIIHSLSLASISPTVVWSSDLRRAQETARPIAEHFGVDLTTSAGLREMNFGSWEGLTWNEVEVQYPEDARAWIDHFPHHRPPRGESFVELQSRVIAELESLAERAERSSVMAVTHAGFIRTAIAWVLGMPDVRISRIAQCHAAINVLEKVRNHWSVTAMNLNLAVFARANGADAEARL